MPSRVDPAAAAEVMRTAGFEPSTLYPGAQAQWPCNCMKCGAEVGPNYDNVRRGLSRGCTSCGRRRGAAKNRLNGEADAIRFAALRKLEPLETYRGLTTPWNCRCLQCGARVAPLPCNLKKGQGGCRRCGHAAKAVKQRGLEAKAVADLLAAGLGPMAPFPGVMNLWPAECLTCGRRVSPRLNNIRSGSGGCKSCQNFGAKLTEPAVVYLMQNLSLGALKVGVSNRSAGRVARHRRHGWQLLTLVRVATGHLAVAIEDAILDWWRVDLGLPFFLGPNEMPQRGWTETVELDVIDIPATIERIKQLAAT